MDFNVYVVTNYAGECLYIGSGVSDRYRHVTSGTSHVYELNQIHFSYVPVNVAIVRDFKTKEDALAYEKELIIEKSPKFNKVHNSRVQRLPVNWLVQQIAAQFFTEGCFPIGKIRKARGILTELFEYIKPQVFYDSFAIINASKANSDEQRCYRKFKWHMTSLASFKEGSIGSILRMVVQSDARSTYRFTDEFKEFLKKSIEK